MSCSSRLDLLCATPQCAASRLPRVTCCCSELPPALQGLEPRCTAGLWLQEWRFKRGSSMDPRVDSGKPDFIVMKYLPRIPDLKMEDHLPVTSKPTHTSFLR
ncbi:hypothetical protein PYW07_013517 [Mythimna separata]|uniref:Uncharacterized protein n=1 Tax=Mythimna separata TaxID=271217 RepID=A0AAD7YB30_MYTSE|nr:hypothetical protein PYW07_013517 [Mythimna separata]